MKTLRRLLWVAVMVFLLLSLCACTDGSGQPNPSVSDLGVFTVTLDFMKQSGYATNQFAVWIEDMDGNYIKTLYATRFTANGGYNKRPDSIPGWVEQSGVDSLSPSEIDAIAGATPRSGTHAYYWDLTDAAGHAVPFEEYRFVVEGSLRWKNRVVYSGVIDIRGDAVTVQAVAEYFLQASDDHPALSRDSSESTMISAVTATWQKN